MAVKHRTLVELNLMMKGMQQSATLAINEKSKQLIENGKQVYQLGFGQSPFPVPQPLVDALSAHAHEKDYLPVKGLFELREAVAQYWKRILNLEYSAEDIMISPGSKNLLFLIQLVTDEILLLPSPSWVSYAPQALLCNKQVAWLKTQPKDDWMLTAETLDAFCRQNPGKSGILVLNYPSNPTGATYTPGQLEALALVAREHGLLIISDEIYAELHHEGNHTSIATFYPEGTIISNGLSKWAGAGGWRLGTFTFPPEMRWLMDAMAVAASETYTTTSAPIQYAAIKAYQQNPVIEAQVIQSRRILKSIGNYVHTRLHDMHITAPKPEGGFYLFPDFSAYAKHFSVIGVNTSIDLCDRLLTETGVALLPSSDFGRPSKELTTRLSYVDFDGEKALKIAGENNDEYIHQPEFIEKCCPHIKLAMDGLENWLPPII